MSEYPENIRKLARVLRGIGSFELQTFTGRLFFQKQIYLLQTLGLPLEYSFSWYLHGPYSPNLTRDGFNLLPIYSKLNEEPLPQEKQIIDRFFSLFGTKTGDKTWLEVISSIHYLNKKFSRTKEEIREVINRKIQSVTTEIFIEAWDILEAAELI